MSQVGKVDKALGLGNQRVVLDESVMISSRDLVRLFRTPLGRKHLNHSCAFFMFETLS